MKRLLTTLIFFITLTSCSLFRFEEISQNIPLETKKICLSSTGKGRIEMKSGKYIFSYESALMNEEEKFIILLNFPIYGEEKFEINWESSLNKASDNSELEHRLLSSGEGIDPKLVQGFISLWSKYFEELIAIQTGTKFKKKSFKWEVKDQKLIASSQGPSIEFISKADVANKDFFEHLTFEVQEKGQKLSSTLKVELFVRECLEKSE